ncbi:hypothetical protein YC2023_011740 [Brassica napus]
MSLAGAKSASLLVLHLYKLDDARKKVVICRVKQLCPFPYDITQYELKRHRRRGDELCQESTKYLQGYEKQYET